MSVSWGQYGQQQGAASIRDLPEPLYVAPACILLWSNANVFFLSVLQNFKIVRIFRIFRSLNVVLQYCPKVSQ